MREALELIAGRYSQGDGSFGTDAGASLVGAHTLWAAVLFLTCRRCGTPFPADLEDRALTWIRDENHRDAVLRVLEETIDLGSGQTYGYVHPTDALAVRVLASKGSRSARLYTEALHRLKDRIDPNGGFYGYRTLSWSTAHAVGALGSATEASFPVRSKQPIERAPAMLAVVGIAFVALVVLGLADSLGAVEASVIAFLVLSTLLALGFISEDTYERVVGKFSTGKRDA